MDGEEAAPQAAVITATRQALEVLQDAWGAWYLIGHNAELGWWAARHGITGHIITAPEPDGLRTAMAGDYGPVKP